MKIKFFGNFVFIITMIFSIVFWFVLFILNHFLLKPAPININKLQIRSVNSIFFNNIFVALLLASGYFTDGTTTLIVATVNSIIIFHFVYPYLNLYSKLYKYTLIVFIMEVSCYIISSFIGFYGLTRKIFNSKVNKSYFHLFIILAIVIIIFLFISAYIENKLILYINTRIEL